jgi:ABC-type transport system substrate-binding protein
VDLGLLVSPDPNPKYGGTFKTGGLSGVALFDLHQCASLACIYPMGPVYDNLVRFDPFAPGMSSVIPDLAKTWDVSDDGLEYTFHLRDAEWHDGTDFTAADVVATYQRIIFPPAGMVSLRKPLFQAVDKIEQIDSKTVKFTLREPRTLFLSAVAFSWNVIYQKKELESNNQDLKAVKLPLGTGPFKFVDYTVGEKWVHEKNDDYWNPDLPFLDGMTILELGRGSPTGKVFIAGQLDFAEGIGGPDIKVEVEKMQDTVSNLYKHPTFTAGWFNTQNPPWDDARMRRAVQWGIDKQALRAGIAHTGFWEGGGWLSTADPRAPDYWEKGTPLGDGTPTKDKIGWRKPTDDDKVKARALMVDVLQSDAGLKDVVLVDRDLAWSNTFSPIFQGLLKQDLNIESKLETYSRTIVFDKFAKGEFDIGIQGASMTLALLEDYWGLVFWSEAPQNWGKWKNDEFDKIYFDILRAEAGPAKNALINRGLEILDEEVPWFIFAGKSNYQAWRTWLKGHRRDLTATSRGPWRWEAAWLDK